MYCYLKCIVYDKLLKPRQSFRITLFFATGHYPKSCQFIARILNVFRSVVFSIVRPAKVGIQSGLSCSDSQRTLLFPSFISLEFREGKSAYLAHSFFK